MLDIIIEINHFAKKSKDLGNELYLGNCVRLRRLIKLITGGEKRKHKSKLNNVIQIKY